MNSMLVLFAAFFALALGATVTNPSQAALDANDSNALRYALTLENFEATFYGQFQTQFNRQAFITAGYAGSVWDSFDLIRQQEEAHVNILNSVLQQRTGTTIPKCTYNFTAITTVSQYVGAARLFENVGTAAYDGAISAVYNRTLQQAAATIATVEGRHAAYLNTIAGVFTPSFLPNPLSPFPNATDYVFPPATVAQLVSPFIVSCPYGSVASILPSVIVVVPVAAPGPNFTPNPSATQIIANDVLALNYALALEILEATFYNQYLAIYGLSAFVSAGLTATDYMYFQMIRDHENAHVSFLRTAVTSLGGTPSSNCTYTFPVANFGQFISVAALLENTGVSAYDGAVNTITDPNLRQAAATVATVEARHAAYLNNLTNTSPFPNTADNATLPADILAIVTRNFINNCPTTVLPPQPLVVIPYSNSTTGLTSSSSTSGPASSTSTTSSASFPVISAFVAICSLALAFF